MTIVTVLCLRLASKLSRKSQRTFSRKWTNVDFPSLVYKKGKTCHQNVKQRDNFCENIMITWECDRFLRKFSRKWWTAFSFQQYNTYQQTRTAAGDQVYIHWKVDRLKLEACEAVSEYSEAATQEEREREAAQPEAAQLAEVGGRQVGGECVQCAPQGQGLQAGKSLWIENQDLVNNHWGILSRKNGRKVSNGHHW